MMHVEAYFAIVCAYRDPFALHICIVLTISVVLVIPLSSNNGWEFCLKMILGNDNYSNDNNNNNYR